MKLNIRHWCQTGKLNKIKELIGTKKSNYSELIILALSIGRLDIAKFLYSHTTNFKMPSYCVFTLKEYVIYCRNLDIIKWLYSLGFKHHICINAFNIAFERNDYDICYWLFIFFTINKMIVTFEMIFAFEEVVQQLKTDYICLLHTLPNELLSNDLFDINVFAIELWQYLFV